MSNEIQQYLNMIDDLRQNVIALISDLPPAALNWRPLPSDDDHATNSLAVLAAHIAGAEHFWLAEVVGGYPPTRERNKEFVTESVGAAELINELDRVGTESKSVLQNLSKTELDGTRSAHGEEVSVRWGILHVIDHTALHLGHMQITYQLWMGGQGKEMPRWYERYSGQ